jgi:2-polyprenyl-3-methyl-5-hydroxy-6-metoxy-1,4-benzoquinol methylase
MTTAAPSDSLRDVYERRGEVEYAVPVVPDPTLDRKFAVVTEELRGFLPVKSLLDAGCGDGRYLASLRRLGPVPDRVVGVDIAESILATAARAAEQAELAVELERANLEHLPFADSEFELVVCFQAIEHLLEPALGIRELARVLAPGGRIVLTTDNSRRLFTSVLNAPRWTAARLVGKRDSRTQFLFPHRQFSEAELRRMFGHCGLVVERVRTYRFSIVGAGPRLVRVCNRIDARLPDFGFGDVILVVARHRLA